MYHEPIIEKTSRRQPLAGHTKRGPPDYNISARLLISGGVALIPLAPLYRVGFRLDTGYGRRAKGWYYPAPGGDKPTLIEQHITRDCTIP